MAPKTNKDGAKAAAKAKVEKAKQARPCPPSVPRAMGSAVTVQPEIFSRRVPAMACLVAFLTCAYGACRPLQTKPSA